MKKVLALILLLGTLAIAAPLFDGDPNPNCPLPPPFKCPVVNAIPGPMASLSVR